jgi:hypothetical protein
MANRLALAVRPNPSLHPTAYSGLRPPRAAGELKGWAAQQTSLRSPNEPGRLDPTAETLR